ncbi:hypothetical protein ACHAXR_006836, partial [Thalassiosira sp. AJA248-18]
QSLSVTEGNSDHSHDRRSTSRGRDAGHRAKQDPSSARPSSAGRPTFPSAPPQQAWGNNKPLHRSAENIDSRKPGELDRKRDASSTANVRNPSKAVEKRGWAKPDSNKSNAEVAGKKQTIAWPKPNSSTQKDVGQTSSAQNTASVVHSKASNNATSFPTGIIKREDSANVVSQVQNPNNNPWAKPVSKETKPMAADNSAFPPWSADGNMNKKTTLPKETPALSSSLPSKSSWGKSSQPPAQSSSSSGWAKPLNRKERKTKVDEFPSLSAFSKTTQNQQQGQKRPPQSSAKTVTPTPAKNKGSSKKSATTANLASFLSPQGGGGATANGKGSKKKLPTVMSSSKKGNSSASGNNPKNHPGLSSMVVGGVKRSAPSSNNNHRGGGGGVADFPNSGKGGAVKKGRQRVAPRKKKLTTLKKRVLKERLRVWQEQNGITVDGGGEETNDNAGGDEQGLTESQPNIKRLKTDGGASSYEAASSSEVSKSTTLLVENFIRPEEDNLDDDDEYDEIISNLISLAGRVGKVLSVFVPRPKNNTGHSMDEEESSTVLEAKHVGLAFVRFAAINDVCAAKDILDGMVVGGQKIHTTVVHSNDMVQFNDNLSQGGSAVAPSAENDRLWRLTALGVMDGRMMCMDENNHLQADNAAPNVQQLGESATTTIIFHEILCDDDYEDEEALQESIEDIRGLAQQYGQVEDARASTSGDDRGNVYIDYGNCDSAKSAMQQLNGIVVGGSTIVVSTNNGSQCRAGEVVLSNVLNDDDFEDEDCLNESIGDIRNLAQKYGTIGLVEAETSGEHKGRVRVSYVGGYLVAQQAAQNLNGLVFGGRTISASSVSATTENINNGPNVESRVPSNDQDSPTLETNKEEPSPHPPMYSGDKIVPERFAACKRVPKIPNSGTPRSYATKIADEQAVPLVVKMLGELMRLQERSKDDKNARARRRLVMGLREVARGVRAHKVKMVIMANNLDDYGAIDTKLQEILDSCNAEDVPVIFELNKRKIGKALGKSIKVSVVGIQNADGAHEQFKKLKKMIGMA